jgi:hypothetical protein
MNDIPQPSPVENDLLIADLSSEEIDETIFQMEHNKALGTTVFLLSFTSKFEDIIKYDIMALFRCFQRGDLTLHKLNFGFITLLPKKENITQIQ